MKSYIEMGKKNRSVPNLGRSLIKDRFGSIKGRKMVDDQSMVRGYLEQSSFNSFKNDYIFSSILQKFRMATTGVG